MVETIISGKLTEFIAHELRTVIGVEFTRNPMAREYLLKAIYSTVRIKA